MDTDTEYKVNGFISDKKVSNGTNKVTNKAWTRYAFTITKDDASSITVSTFSFDLGDAWVIGDPVTCHYRSDGKYNTLVGFETLDVLAARTPVAKYINEGRITPSTPKSESPNVIVRQNVLNRAVDEYIAGKLERADILKKAEEYEKWVLR